MRRDLTKSLDIVTLLRKLRMHGIALTSLLTRQERKIIAGLAKKKKLLQGSKDDWDVEGREGWAIHFMRKVRGIQAAKKTLNYHYES